MAEKHALKQRKGRPKYWEQNGKDGEKGRIRLKRKRPNGSPVYITLPHGPDSETFPDLCTAEPVLDLLDQVLKVVRKARRQCKEIEAVEVLELLAAWLGMSTEPVESQNVFQWALSYPLCALPQSQLDVLLDTWHELYPQGTEKKTKLVLVPIDLKRKSSENLPVDSKQLKTAEPVLVATLLSPSSTSTAAEEALSSSAVDQPEHWQEMQQNDCLLSDLMAKAELAEISEDPVADHSAAASGSPSNPFSAELQPQVNAGFTQQACQSWDNQAEGPESPTAEGDPAVLWLNAAGESPQRSHSNHLLPTSAPRASLPVPDTSYHSGDELEQANDAQDTLQGTISADPVQGANDLLARINEQLDQLGIHGAPSSSWPGSLGQSHSSNAPISIHSSVAGGAKELDGDVTSPLVPEAISEGKPNPTVSSSSHAQPSNHTSPDAIFCSAPDQLEHVAEAGDAQPIASTSDMQGSLSACDHQRGSDSGVTSPEGIADGEVNSACLHKEAPSKRFKSSLHQAESERWPFEPAEEQRVDSVTQTVPAVRESVIDVPNGQLSASGSRTSVGLKRELEEVAGFIPSAAGASMARHFDTIRDQLAEPQSCRSPTHEPWNRSGSPLINTA